VIGFACVVTSVACAPRPEAAQSAHDAKHVTSADTQGSSALPRPLLAKTFRYRFAIYTERAPAFDVRSEIERGAASAGFRLSAEPGDPEKPTTPSSLFWAQPPIERFLPPDAAALEHFGRGLSDSEKSKLARARSVILFELTGAGARALEDYPEAVKLAREFTQAFGGYFWDDETRNAYDADALGPAIASWQEGLPDVRSHVTLHLYQDGELLRIVSLGMIKFGLPDVVINQVPGSDAESMGNLANLVMQTLIERGSLDGPERLRVAIDRVKQPTLKAALESSVLPGAERSVELTLVPGTLEEGDADNRLLEIAFPGPPETLQERQNHALSVLFGAEDDGIVRVKHDAQLLAASRRAREKALSLKPRFEHGPPLGETLLVKAPFQTPQREHEWMWVEVTSWKGPTIAGILRNDPVEVPGLKAGARVEVQADQIFDYILKKRDGTIEGNETAKLIEAQ
jgi:uncharacterized protein YegJ (DUF2314 family)